MPQLADYFISSVQYDFKHKNILKVTRHLDKGDFVARGNIVNRNILSDDLKKGLTYKTIHRDKNNHWVIGEAINLIPNTGFITITPNNTDSDYLGNLPEF